MYSTEKVYNTYAYYVAIKRHFKSDYDFFKYAGKTKLSQHKFETRRDKYYFYKLSNLKNARDLLLSNVIEDPDVWIGELFEKKAEDICANWTRINQSLTYTFKSDIGNMLDDFDENFIVTDGQYPPFLNMFLHKKITLHTLIIVTRLVGCLKYWNKNIDDTILWPSLYRKITKTHPFLQYDAAKMKKILLDKFNTVHQYA